MLSSNSFGGARGFARGFARGASARGAARGTGDVTRSSGNLRGVKGRGFKQGSLYETNRTQKKSIDHGKSLKIYHTIFLSIGSKIPPKLWIIE